MIVMVGKKKAAGVLPAIIACGVSFAGVQFYVSNHLGPELTDIMSSLTCIGVMVLVLKLWKPREIMRLEGDKPLSINIERHAPAQVFMAWLPYMLLVVAVLTFGAPSIKSQINTWTDGFMPDSVRAQPVVHPTVTGRLNRIMVPGLHNMITQVPPVVPTKTPYGALFELNWLTASGTACFIAAIAAALCLGVGPRKFGGIYVATFKQLSKAILTIASMLGLAYLMNYSGMTSMAGCVPDRKRYLRQCPVWKPSGCDGQRSASQPHPDRFGQFRGRCDGENDFHSEHRCCSCRDGYDNGG